MGGRIIGCIVIACHKQQCQYRKHRPCTGKPDSLVERRLPQRTDDAPKHSHHTNQEYKQHYRHLQEVHQILVRFHEHLSRFRTDSVAVGHQCTDDEGQEEHQKQCRISPECPAAASHQVVLIDVINKIERPQDARQEEHSQPEHHIPRIEQRIQPVSCIGPLTDDRHHRICHIPFIDVKFGPREERGHCPTQQYRTYHSVYHQERAIRCLAQQISRLRLELVADSLQHKAEQNNHPQPIGSSETRTIEQRKRSKERASKRDERCKRELPLPSRRINHHLLLLLRLPQTEQKRITSLHEQQEYQQCSQQGDYKPPIVLKKYISIHCEL